MFCNLKSQMIRVIIINEEHSEYKSANIRDPEKKLTKYATRY